MSFKQLIREVQADMNQLGERLTVDGVPGPVTQAAMEKYGFEVTAKKLTFPEPAAYTHMHPYDWIVNQQKTLNPKERPGTKDNNPVIQEYLEHCDNIGGFKDGKLHPDEVPWCSALPNAAADACGCVKTNNALASSWDRYPGRAYKKGDLVRRGALVRIAHPGGHITCAEEDFIWTGEGTFPGRGGNQSNRINVSPYYQSTIVSVHDWLPKEGTLLAPIGTSPEKITGKIGDSTK